MKYVAGRQVLAIVREQRNSWLAARLEELSPEAREVLHAAVGPLDQVSMGDR